MTTEMEPLAGQAALPVKKPWREERIFEAKKTLHRLDDFDSVKEFYAGIPSDKENGCCKEGLNRLRRCALAKMADMAIKGRLIGQLEEIKNILKPMKCSAFYRLHADKVEAVLEKRRKSKG